MDMLAFITQNTYDQIISSIHARVQTATEIFFQQPCTKEKNLTSEHQGEEQSTELTVSVDVTWKKRGYTGWAIKQLEFESAIKKN